MLEVAAEYPGPCAKSTTSATETMHFSACSVLLTRPFGLTSHTVHGTRARDAAITLDSEKEAEGRAKQWI